MWAWAARFESGSGKIYIYIYVPLCLGSKALALAFAGARRACGWDDDVGPSILVVVVEHFCIGLSGTSTSDRRAWLWCGHTSANTPDPIRTPQLSALGPEQYWDG